MSKNRFFGITSRVLMLVAAGLLLLSYLSVVINPAKLWVITLFGLMFVPFLLLNFMLFLWALKRRSRAFVIPLLALLPSLFFMGRYFRFQGSDKAVGTDGARTVKLVSYNVGRFFMCGGNTDCADSIFHRISSESPDIICFQEFYVDRPERIKRYMAGNFKGYNIEYYLFSGKYGYYGNVTLSRFPVRNKGKIKFDKSANLSLFTDYSVRGSSFRVYNCHFESYNISLPGIVKAMHKGDNVVRETGDKMRRSILRRPRQVEQVMAHVDGCGMNTIVCGDFNDNPMSYTYYRLIKDRRDSFVAGGKGFGATYSFLWPMLRLDYVLVPSQYEVLSHRTEKLPFSDHYPVIVEFEI